MISHYNVTHHLCVHDPPLTRRLQSATKCGWKPTNILAVCLVLHSTFFLNESRKRNPSVCIFVCMLITDRHLFDFTICCCLLRCRLLECSRWILGNAPFLPSHQVALCFILICALNPAICAFLLFNNWYNVLVVLAGRLGPSSPLALRLLFPLFLPSCAWAIWPFDSGVALSTFSEQRLVNSDVVVFRFDTMIDVIGVNTAMSMSIKTLFGL